MRVTTEAEKDHKEFKPIPLSILLETKEEAEQFRHLFNHSAVVVGFPSIDSADIRKAIDDELQKQSVKINSFSEVTKGFRS